MERGGWTLFHRQYADDDGVWWVEPLDRLRALLLGGVVWVLMGWMDAPGPVTVRRIWAAAAVTDK
jgi:hypothetical protein